MENSEAKFLKVFADIPEDLRNDIICVVDEKTYTWNTAYLQIKDYTPLGNKILKALENIELI